MTTKEERENSYLKKKLAIAEKFVKDVANHDWDLSEMGAEEVYNGAQETLEQMNNVIMD